MKTIYQCEICGSKYSDAKTALECEARPMQDMSSTSPSRSGYEPKVGEVVECAYPAFSWWHGDPDWAVARRRGGRFVDGFYNKWVVVAKIPAGDWHGWKYILWSPSDENGREKICWTGPRHTGMWPNRFSTGSEMAAATLRFDAINPKGRIPLL